MFHPSYYRPSFHLCLFCCCCCCCCCSPSEFHTCDMEVCHPRMPISHYTHTRAHTLFVTLSQTYAHAHAHIHTHTHTYTLPSSICPLFILSLYLTHTHSIAEALTCFSISTYANYQKLDRAIVSQHHQFKQNWKFFCFKTPFHPTVAFYFSAQMIGLVSAKNSLRLDVPIVV